MININNKRWDQVNGNDIKKVLSGDDDESFFYEFKSDEVASNKLAKEISALANTYGGYIFLGVNDDKSIGGCKKWTEQGIHTTIHDSLTPTPNFDVRRFRIDEKTIFVIKVEEGILPPYITTGKGVIYERLSSGSIPVKDSSRLTHLYNKRADQEARVKAKIEFGDIESSKTLPNNLCGYIDIGFYITCSELTFLQKNFYSIDLQPMLNEIVGTNLFSVSRVGDAFMFSFGEIDQRKDDGADYLIAAGMHNYLIVHTDCSASCRILLSSDPGGNLVDISLLPIVTDVFMKIYNLLCGDDFSKIFIHAQKYESIKVLKQFVPAYDIVRHFKDVRNDPYKNVLQNHREKYGENLIVQSNRVPSYGYDLIDKQWFNKLNIEYNQTELIKELFHTNYFHLGFVDSHINFDD